MALSGQGARKRMRERNFDPCCNCHVARLSALGELKAMSARPFIKHSQQNNYKRDGSALRHVVLRSSQELQD